jgi:para-nitrobenzyl esterase
MRLIWGIMMLAAASLSPVTAQAKGPEVIIASGKLRGAISEGVAWFKGIPFAAPPVGALRWRAPQPVAAWKGTRNATDYAHDCMQLPFPSDAAPLGTAPAEDCLYANVWRPASPPAGKLPVIVWIYGGGFVNGGSSPPTYSGAELAKQGVMFVSFNYRVGRFGTFAHPQLSKADPDKGLLGNYGFLDQIAALQWVQRNAAAFGGDADNVTIIGESAGGMSVHALLTSPLAQGLFARAVVQSGGDPTHMEDDGGLVGAERAGLVFAAMKGIAADDPRALEKLRALSAQDVTGDLNLAKMIQPDAARPFADGRIAVKLPDGYAAPGFRPVPVMVGATANDIGGKTGWMASGARNFATLIAAKGVPAWYYRFSYVAESLPAAERAAGANHASDIPFFFHTEGVKYGAATTPTDRAIGGTISAYLINFARNGDPNGKGLPTWKPYSRASDEMMDFASDGRAVAGRDPLGAEMDGVKR